MPMRRICLFVERAEAQPMREAFVANTDQCRCGLESRRNYRLIATPSGLLSPLGHTTRVLARGRGRAVRLT
ncbi:hypothetical protein XFF6992_80128 [Xanthomonas citri pv. fuscans]|nr:hypothetical protein XFF6992_80128 [Xanthomonas citri pv. fuscans]SOO35562.1 hypothetical protein XFF6994_5440016 [Xanthomonas citri pv. fuscans]